MLDELGCLSISSLSFHSSHHLSETSQFDLTVKAKPAFNMAMNSHTETAGETLIDPSHLPLLRSGVS